MTGDSKQQDLAAENQALDLYLDSLYDDTGRQDEPDPSPVVSLIPGGAGAAPAVASAADDMIPGPERDKVTPFVRKKNQSQLNLMRVLLFNLCGLKMAILMDDLDDVVEWPEQLVSAPESMPLYIGLLQENGQCIPVIDLARLILPARLRDQKSSLACQRILLIGNRCWGLACNGVSEVVSVESSAVNWRTERTSRKWLAGTIGSYGSALLDAGALEGLLKQDG